MKKQILAAILCLFCMYSLSAQPVSPLKEATAGLFGTESDSITSLTGWNSPVFERALLTAIYGFEQNQNNSTGKGTILNANVINAAALIKAGKSKYMSTKIGMAYTGEFGNDILLQSTQKGSGTIKTHTVPFFHNIYFLVGLPGNKYAIRAGLTVGGSYSRTQDTAIPQNATHTNTLSFKPSFAFGAILRTPSRYVITPTLEANVVITNGGGTAAASFSSGSVSGTGSDGKPYKNIRVYRAYTPAFKLGCGIAFPSKMGILSWSSNFSYAFSTLYMPQKYEQKIQGGNTLTDEVYRPDSGMTHCIDAGVSLKAVVSWRLTVKTGLSVRAGYAHRISGGSIRHSTHFSAPAAKQTSETHAFDLIPHITAAAAYNITEHISWFTGAGFRPVTYRLTHEKLHDEKITVGDAQNTRSSQFDKPLLTHLGMGIRFKPAGGFSISCALVLKPSETSPVRTINDIFGANIRLGVSWKGIPHN